ncbi:Uncharacterised protein [Mycobacterium tuberculosis]|uniref:Uncharacterized protein n=1 Tax=Mycobacterium tuberculosis TaxID=1773 RepID=A0A0U0RA47_MYCTX|nr:Uncharacterised protein [Mycobacterium tuberculosis]COV31867.1 Uncharacterised protein [Mycobacterium tuberculosis]COV91524.1 Uncharacterised protein [Mycobacterium tuberculosis]COW20043.1 Uncharacterised protein [Mycobacterium tuberculosis]COY04094.1 Uncharacterised protein [Mycobacterium tuberculosis]
MRLSSRACAQIISAAARYSANASASVRSTAAKSTPWPGTTFIPDSRSAKVLSPRARAEATACALVIPPGSPRPITPLNSKSVAWPRIRGTMTPIVVPAIPSVITAMLSRRCGASRFTSRAADPQKSRDRMFGGGLAARGRAPGGAVTLHPRPWRSAIVRRRIRHRWGNRPAAFRGCPCRRSYRYRQR